MVKQAVKVVIRARPTANFATKNIKLEPLLGVTISSLYENLSHKSLISLDYNRKHWQERRGRRQ